MKMKFWTILALSVVGLAVFLRVGYAEKTDESEDFQQKALDDVEDAEP